MTNEIQDFDKSELKFLKDLRFIYDTFDPGFKSGKNGAYIPLGLLIVYTSMIVERVNKNAFSSKEKLLYAKFVNWEYLYLGELFADILESENLTMCHPRTLNPVSTKLIKSLLKKIHDGENDNYAGILAYSVAFDEVIEVLENTSGLSVNDPRIIAVYKISETIQDEDSKILDKYHYNDLIYEPIKDCLLIEEKSDLDTASSPVGERFNAPISRENEMHREISYVRDQIMNENRTNSKPSYKDVWDEIKSIKESGASCELNDLLTKIDDTELKWKSIYGNRSSMKLSSFKSIYTKINNKYPIPEIQG